MKFLGVLLVLAAFTAHAQTPDELTMLALVNEQRAAADVPPLAWNDQLYAAAKEHSDDLAAHGGMCDLHNSCDGEVWFKRVGRYYPGWYDLGENVAVSVSDPQTVLDGWMDSDGHRANILDWHFVEAGAAAAGAKTDFGVITWWTMDFGSRFEVPAPTRTPRATPTPGAGDTIDHLRITRHVKTVVTGLVVMPAGAGLMQVPVRVTIGNNTVAFQSLQPIGRGVRAVGAPRGYVFRLVPAMRTLYRFRVEIPGEVPGTAVKLQAAGKEWTS